MPCSIAAWRTVFPFSTVTCRPSIVSVTVSIRSDDINFGRLAARSAWKPFCKNPLTWALRGYAVRYMVARKAPANLPSREAPMDAASSPSRCSRRMGRSPRLFWPRHSAVGSLIVGQRASRGFSAERARGSHGRRHSAAVPAGAVSVPVLPFSDGKEIRVGDTAATVATRLGRAGRERPPGSRSRTPGRAPDAATTSTPASASSSSSSPSNATASRASPPSIYPEAAQRIDSSAFFDFRERRRRRG